MSKLKIIATFGLCWACSFSTNAVVSVASCASSTNSSNRLHVNYNTNKKSTKQPQSLVSATAKQNLLMKKKSSCLKSAEPTYSKVEQKQHYLSQQHRKWASLVSKLIN